jgi:hypothetical protein
MKNEQRNSPVGSYYLLYRPLARKSSIALLFYENHHKAIKAESQNSAFIVLKSATGWY